MRANIGIRAHDIEDVPLEEAVKIISQKGLTAVQLAVSKSITDVNTGPGSFSPGFARHVNRMFQAEYVQIAVLGCYINLIHPDLDKRRTGLERFKEHIRFARDFGCSIVGTETGNVNADIVYTEDNFSEQPFWDVVENVRELVTEAEKFGVIVGIEGGINHPIHTPARMRRLLDSVPSNHLQVIFDPVNFISPDNYQNQEAVFQEACELFGDRMVIMHAKDFKIEDNQIKFVPAGKGILNYKYLLKTMKEKKPYLNILLEEAKVQDIDECVAYINALYSEIN